MSDNVSISTGGTAKYVTDDDKIAEHALRVPLITRLRGDSFIPGVHYAKQAEQWMLEAAQVIEFQEHLLEVRLSIIRQLGGHIAEGQ